MIGSGAEPEGKNTDEVKRKTKKMKLETIWKVSEERRATESAIARPPKNIVPMTRENATSSAPLRVHAMLYPRTGKARPKTSREPAMPMISVARTMPRMYCARLKGPISICSNIPFFLSYQSWVPALVPPLMTVRRHRARREVDVVGDEPPVAQVDGRDYPVVPVPLDEDEEEGEDELEEERGLVEVRPDVAVDQPHVGVQPAFASLSAPSIMLMNASSRVVSEM